MDEDEFESQVGNSEYNRTEAAGIAEHLRDLANKWENCPEAGLPHCECVTDAARFREMAATIMEIAGF